MSGLCGWIGANKLVGSAEETLANMAAGLPSIGTLDEASSARHEAALRLKAIKGTGSWHQHGSIVAALEGTPRWADERLAAHARDQGHAAALITAYRENGAALLDSLRGAFALALVDIESQSGLLAIDRYGINGLCFSMQASGSLVFGSTVNSVRAHPAIASTLEPQAIYDFLFFVDRIPAPHTVYAEQRKLRAGECLVFERGEASLRSYWKIGYREDSDRSVEDLSEEMRSCLRTAVRRTVDEHGSENTGAFLSGGLDSSTVAGFLAEASDRPPKTYTIGFDVDGFDESHFAAIAAEHFGTEHSNYAMTPQEVFDAIPRLAEIYDEPFANSSAVPTYICASRAAAGGTDVLLAGDGGDEIFAGNSRYVQDMVFDHYARVPKALRRGLIEPVLAGFPGGNAVPLIRRGRNYVRQAKMSPAWRIASHNVFRYATAEQILAPHALAAIELERPLGLLQSIYDGSPGASKLKRLMAVDLRITLADSDLRKVNRACELAGVGVRYPFLDDDVVEFSAGVPSDLLIKDGRLRHFYKEAMRDVLPREIIAKSKHGFGLPFVDFAAGHAPLRELACDSISGLKKRGLFSLRWLDTFLKGSGNSVFSLYGGAFWDLMMLELWFQRHYDRPPGTANRKTASRRVGATV